MKISLCIGVCNRGELFRRSILSLVNRQDFRTDPALEIVAVDFGSEDFTEEDFKTCCRIADVEGIWIPVDNYFAKARAHNIGAQNATGDILFFGDTDIRYGECFTRSVTFNCSEGYAWFPIILFEGTDIQERFQRYLLVSPEAVEAEYPEKADNCYWAIHSYGMNAVTRKDFFEKTPGWDESFKRYGGEDKRFFEECSKTLEVTRRKDSELTHMWHIRNREWQERFHEPK